MKTATCKQLRGACDQAFSSNSPQEMGDLCRQHVEDMLEKNDKAHMKAVESMRELSPTEQKEWYDAFLKMFADLPEVE